MQHQFRHQSHFSITVIPISRPGSEPVQLREALQRALPRSPPHDAQMVKEPAILHTTIARLLLPPDAQQQQGVGGGETSSEIGRSLSGGGVETQGLNIRGTLQTALQGDSFPTEGVGGINAAEVIQAVDALSDALCGTRVQFRCG